MKTLITLLCVGLLLPTVAMAEGLPSPDADMEAVVRGNNTFAIDLYRQLDKQPGNLFFSPESISMALAMAYAGARGETATEMASVLHFTLPSEKLHPAMGALLHDLNTPHDDYQLRVANALWGQQGYTFLDTFLTLSKGHYAAGFRQVDFKGNAETSRQAINVWVAQQTENRIKDPLAPGTVTKATRLVLTNAIYFKGDWQVPFDKKFTQDEDFHVTAGKIIKAPMMHRTGRFAYFHTVNGTEVMFQALELPYNFKALQLPYEGTTLSMIILLPDATDGLSSLELSLTQEVIQQTLTGLMPREGVIVTMPKFQMETAFWLNDTLGVMGVKQAFNPKTADFSGMASKEMMREDGNLYISAVIHKAFVDVNEEGTEAAAASAILAPSVVTVPPVPVTFRVDHPFLFLIRDNTSGSILFMGRVADPSR